MDLSIIIPLYNEQENVKPLCDELAFLTEHFSELEILLVDDGSIDSTWSCIEAEHAERPYIKGVKQEKNAGQSAAMLRGLHSAQYSHVALLDGDLQNDPADIPKLVAELKTHDVACGRRAKRKDTWSRRYGSKLANKVRNMVTHDGLADTGCSLKAFHKKCVNDLPCLEGMHRFMGAYFVLNGRSISQIDVNHRHRQFGESKYTNLKRLPRTIKDLWGFAWYKSRYIGQAVHPSQD